MRQVSFAPLTLALVALLNGAPSWAGVSAGSFAVGITLGTPGSVPGPVPPQQPPGACQSRSLSEQARAQVEVTCTSGEFVTIQAVRGGTLATGFGWEAAPGAGYGWAGGSGTVTMLRLFDSTWDGLIELRVSF